MSFKVSAARSCNSSADRPNSFETELKRAEGLELSSMELNSKRLSRIRVFISFTALLVKVKASIFLKPIFLLKMIFKYSLVNVWVLPEPAEAL